jgi:GNAT superfamily N-acetyltransferase
MSSSPQSDELHLTLNARYEELVRAFARESLLSDAAPTEAASSLAESTLALWRLLCRHAGDERVRLLPFHSGKDAGMRFVLHGYSRFSALAASHGSITPKAEITWRAHGVDGWEVRIRETLAPPALVISEEEPSSETAISDTNYAIETPSESDASAIARCFLQVYGRHYVHPEVFSPRRYWTKVSQGELIPMVARDASGEVVGHVALERGPGTKVAERGEAVVLPQHRGRGLLERMTERLSEEAIHQGFVGIYAEPLTIHTFSQRNDERAGMPVCAALLGVNPEKFGPKEMQANTGQRQSYLCTFRFLSKPAPRSISAPARYRDILSELYAWLGVSISFDGGVSKGADGSKSAIKVNGRGYGVIAFEAIGPSAAIELHQAFRDVRALGASSIQLSARIDDPRLSELGAAAQSLGFFFCGLGPGFADGSDTFSVQWLSEGLDTSKLQLFTNRAKRLVAFIEGDRSDLAAAR